MPSIRSRSRLSFSCQNEIAGKVCDVVKGVLLDCAGI